MMFNYFRDKKYTVKKKFGSGLTWDFISWVKSITKLPVLLKGILTAEDAKLAVQHGADAIMCQTMVEDSWMGYWQL